MKKFNVNTSKTLQNRYKQEINDALDNLFVTVNHSTLNFMLKFSGIKDPNLINQLSLKIKTDLKTEIENFKFDWAEIEPYQLIKSLFNFEKNAGLTSNAGKRS